MINKIIIVKLLLLLKNRMLCIIKLKYREKIRKEIGMEKDQFYAKTKMFLYGLLNNFMIFPKDGEKISVYSHPQMSQRIMFLENGVYIKLKIRLKI
jgi:hypothetical protein